MINHQNLTYNYNIPAKEAFKLITSNAAKIIHREQELGYLKEGYCADFLVYDIKGNPSCTHQDPYNLIIFNIDNKKNLKEVFIKGQQAWIRERILNKI
jgi:imidazolonepropionase-like amidohydrolase